MLRTIVVDDELTARKRLERLLTAMPHVELVGSCASGDELIALLRTHNDIDVLLLDIQMPEMTGMELASLLPDDGPAVIFVTAHEAYAVQAFALGVVDYVVKPVTPERLKMALERVTRPEKTNKAAHKIPIKTHKGVILVDSEQISHASYDGVLVTLHLEQRSLHTESTLTELEDRLADQGFMRVHRRHLLNLDWLDRLESLDSGGYNAHMRGGDVIPVSRQAARTLRKQLGLS